MHLSLTRWKRVESGIPERVLFPQESFWRRDLKPGRSAWMGSAKRSVDLLADRAGSNVLANIVADLVA